MNDRVYIGSSIDVHIRLNTHKAELRRGCHHAIKFQKDWDKFGENSFVFELIEECSIEILRSREQYYIDLEEAYTKGYNSHPEASPFSYMPEKQKRRIGEGNRKAAENNPNLRRQRSERAKAQHAAGALGRSTWPDGLIPKIGRRRGHKVNPESIKRMIITKKTVEWEKPGRRERQAEIAKELQNRPGFKEYMRKRQQAYWTPERRAEQAERARNQQRKPKM